MAGTLLVTAAVLACTVAGASAQGLLKDGLEGIVLGSNIFDVRLLLPRAEFRDQRKLKRKYPGMGVSDYTLTGSRAAGRVNYKWIASADEAGAISSVSLGTADPSVTTQMLAKSIEALAGSPKEIREPNDRKTVCRAVKGGRTVGDNVGELVQQRSYVFETPAARITISKVRHICCASPDFAACHKWEHDWGQKAVIVEWFRR